MNPAGVKKKQTVESPYALTFKIASEEWEFELIHRLNYETFVEEIPQHPPNPSRSLVDRFHDQNTYIICLRGDQLFGMVAARAERPFSLDHKLNDLDSYLPPSKSPCEIRLLAVEREHRRGQVMKGLLTRLAEYCIREGHDIALISGTVRQQSLYGRLGLTPFGPLVGTPGAMYQPAYGVPAQMKEQFKAHFGNSATSVDGQRTVNLLPGPVGISRKVSDAFAQVPVSHRAEAFVRDFNGVRRQLCRLVKSEHVQLLMGSGTLANDAIAGQLSLSSGHGLVLTNGEFGDRLVDHAERSGLSFDTLAAPWGQTFDRKGVEEALDRDPDIAWVWAVHCETSTGVLNDIAMLKDVSSKRAIQLCMDCISSIGSVSVDLQGVYLASGVSGKGLGAFPGLSTVFHDHDIRPAPKALPRYLDLGLRAAKNGVPFTMSSNLIYALRAALERFESEAVFDEIAEISRWLKIKLRLLGFEVVAPDAHASPGVITIKLPSSVSSRDVGRRLEKADYLLSYNSDYLHQRNLIQICLMGECSREAIAPLLSMIAESSPQGPGAARAAEPTPSTTPLG